MQPKAITWKQAMIMFVAIAGGMFMGNLLIDTFISEGGSELSGSENLINNETLEQSTESSPLSESIKNDETASEESPKGNTPKTTQNSEQKTSLERCWEKYSAIQEEIIKANAKLGPYLLIDPQEKVYMHFNSTDQKCYAVSTYERSFNFSSYLLDVDSDKILGDYHIIYDDTGGSNVVCRIMEEAGCTYSAFNQFVTQKIQTSYSWKQFLPPNGLYSVLLPIEPNDESYEIVDTKAEMYVSRPVPNVSYGVISAVLPDEGLTVEQTLNLVVGGVIFTIDSNGQYTTTAPVTLNSIQGLSYNTNAGHFRYGGKVFFDPKSRTAYMASWNCSYNDCKQADIDKFMNSFAILTQ